MLVSAGLALNPDEESDRRIGPRHISILRVGRVVWDDRDQLCVIRNISPGGMMFECLHVPGVGQQLSIELRSDKQMTGVVRWVREGHAGIEFDREINVEQVLKEDRSSLLRVRPRAPRFIRRGMVRLLGEGEGEPVLAEINDISIGGVRCRPDLPIRRNEPIVAVIEGIGATNAEVRWLKGDLAGVRFEKPLPWRAFQLWLDKAPRGG